VYLLAIEISLNNNNKENLKQHSLDDNDVDFLKVYFFLLHKVANYIANLITKNFIMQIFLNLVHYASSKNFCFFRQF